jgi:hypothetical protein
VTLYRALPNRWSTSSRRRRRRASRSLQVRNDLEQIATPDQTDTVVGLAGLFHHAGSDLDPLSETRSGDGGPCPLDVPLDRVDANTAAARTQDKGDQVARVSAADVEESALGPEQRTG